jgi:DNA-binding CsgD family transcriptional regulator
VDETRSLSPRELEVVLLVVEGLSNREIACHLAISPRTVQAHLANAMKQTGTRTRTQLAVFALRCGIAPLRPRDLGELRRYDAA